MGHKAHRAQRGRRGQGWHRTAQTQHTGPVCAPLVTHTPRRPGRRRQMPTPPDGTDRGTNEGRPQARSARPKGQGGAPAPLGWLCGGVRAVPPWSRSRVSAGLSFVARKRTERVFPGRCGPGRTRPRREPRKDPTGRGGWVGAPRRYAVAVRQPARVQGQGPARASSGPLSLHPRPGRVAACGDGAATVARDPVRLRADRADCAPLSRPHGDGNGAERTGGKAGALAAWWCGGALPRGVERRSSMLRARRPRPRNPPARGHRPGSRCRVG